MLTEINFDGIIGPSHNYAGLSLGNIASANNAGSVSEPRAAALQGMTGRDLRCRIALTEASPSGSMSAMQPTCRASIGGTAEVASGRRHVAHTMPPNAHSHVRRISQRDRGFRAAFPVLICSKDERGCG